MALNSENCLKVMDGVCQFGPTVPVFKAFLDLAVASILNQRTLGFYSNPMNSVTGKTKFGIHYNYGLISHSVYFWANLKNVTIKTKTDAAR